MNIWSSKIPNRTDCHVHMGAMDGEEHMLAIQQATGMEKMSFVAIQNPKEGSGLAGPLQMKLKYPDRFYVFAGLNHARTISEDQVEAFSLAEQVDRFIQMGCDGIKMIEGKPTSRQVMDIPVTDPTFASYWETVEDRGFPILWHVNDPEEFWDPDLLPSWAKERNWGYGPEDVQKEELYQEVDEILKRHPTLTVIFAHFYFLSADLPRAGRFLDEHPTVHFDLAPGIEMLYNISKDPDKGRAFFTKYAERILLGTDLMSPQTVKEGTLRAGILFRWLETEDAFRVPEEADFLLGPPEDGIIRGMCLPEEILRLVYRDNFVRIAGGSPKPLQKDQVAAFCRETARIAESLSGKPAQETQAGQLASVLE